MISPNFNYKYQVYSTINLFKKIKKDKSNHLKNGFTKSRTLLNLIFIIIVNLVVITSF